MLWKNRNVFISEGREFSAEDTVMKVREDSKEWFDAQKLELSWSGTIDHNSGSLSRWEAPREGLVKCNVGVSWSKRNWLMGASWIVRNEHGDVLLHSRRAFGNVNSLAEGRFLGLMWAIESMASHRLHKVIFETEAMDLVGVVLRPKAWPAFRYQGTKLRNALEKINEWSLSGASVRVNRCAAKIADSVTMEMRYQSYVARGAPEWMCALLEDDKQGR